MVSFRITSKCCFRGLLALPGSISWENTEMLLCSYCIGISPKMENGNGFWHHCRDLGMIIILASTTVGSMRELFWSISLSLCVYVCLWQGMEIQDSFRANASWVSSHLPVSYTPLSFCSFFLPMSFASLCSCFPSLLVWTRVVYDGGYLTRQQVKGSVFFFAQTRRRPAAGIFDKLLFN